MPRVNEPLKVPFCMGDSIRAMRFQSGLDQSEVARKSGLTAEKISRFELGKISPRVDELVAVCNALGFELKIEMEGRGFSYHTFFE